MRILHVVSSLDPRSGGPVIALEGLARAQSRAALSVSVVTSFREGDDTRIAGDFDAAGIRTSRVGPCHGPLCRHPQMAPLLDELCATHDIVHIHGLWEDIQYQAARLARRHQIPAIFRPCGMLDPWSLKQSALKKSLYMALRLRRTLNSVAAIHYTTHTEARLAAPLRLRPSRIVLPNGVNWSDYDSLPARDAFRTRYPQLASEPIILFLGRLHPKKGIELLILAFARQKIGRLVIAGPGEEEYVKELRRKVEETGIADRTVFTGMLQGEAKLEALTAARIFVLPSYQENFGNAVVEALACGTGVIISDQVNLCHAIERGKVGEVVPLSGDALTRALARSLAGEDTAEERHHRRRFVQRNFDWQRIAEKWKNAYSRLKDRESRHRRS